MMSRWVEAKTRGAVTADGSGAMERIVKYVPVEIVTVYTLVVGLAGAMVPDVAFLPLGLIGTFSLVSLAYVWRNAPAESRAAHAVLSVVAFTAWAYPITALALADQQFYVVWVAFGLQVLALALSLFVVPWKN